MAGVVSRNYHDYQFCLKALGRRGVRGTVFYVFAFAGRCLGAMDRTLVNSE